MTKGYAPGARVVVRDAEWLVRRVDRTSSGGDALRVVGISELVRNIEATFLTEIDKDIEVLDPVNTRLVADPSHGYQASLLYIESNLRQTSPTDESLHIGHRGAMDLVPYQLEPAILSLRQPRQRILMADAVGLGKTIEAGILLSELIRRGRGKRILVVVIKSMLTQFQKELWCRFTIPLFRLDSIGIQRIRSRIPTNHNPFHYYDRAIISIDTLKQDSEYRNFLENAEWDIIVIDEAQNVAERGGSSSLRARLAKLLAERSDTLIMLSATPHDGKARSFASLMNMLDPTAIANPEEYGPDEIRGLFIRRFKKDIKDQVEKAFKERRISVAHCEASSAEEEAFRTFTEMQFTKLDQKRTAGALFKTTLEKALFSSPAACLQTINSRIKNLRALKDPLYEKDIQALSTLEKKVSAIRPEEFSRYQKLLNVIYDKEHGFGWTGKDPLDRLVIFTERIETLKFLHNHLPGDLSLRDEQVQILHGSMSDVEQQRIVEDFGRDDAAVRLLIASDVASEGINLHFLSHRMIHFDIPWSLMVFQQRNGRIDRYGQERSPEILYLVTVSRDSRIRGDMRILELLIKKEEEATRNIGDPAALMGVYDIEEEEKRTALAIEEGKTPEEFERYLEGAAFDPLALLMGEIPQPRGDGAAITTKKMPSLFEDEYYFLASALNFISSREKLQVELYPDEKRIELTTPEDLLQIFKMLPQEVLTSDGVVKLSTDRETITREIKRSRKEETAWPDIQYLWELNPVSEWACTKVLAAFGRHEAPVISLEGALTPGEVIFLMSGLLPNRKGQPLVQNWFGVGFINGRFDRIHNLEALIARTGLGKRVFPNRDEAIDVKPLEALLPFAVEKARDWMRIKRARFEEVTNRKLQENYDALDRLRTRQLQQLALRFGDCGSGDTLRSERGEKEKRRITELFDKFFKWMEETMDIEETPFIQVIAVMRGCA